MQKQGGSSSESINALHLSRGRGGADGAYDFLFDSSTFYTIEDATPAQQVREGQMFDASLIFHCQKQVKCQKAGFVRTYKLRTKDGPNTRERIGYCGAAGRTEEPVEAASDQVSSTTVGQSRVRARTRARACVFPLLCGVSRIRIKHSRGCDTHHSLAARSRKAPHVCEVASVCRRVHAPPTKQPQLIVLCVNPRLSSVPCARPLLRALAPLPGLICQLCHTMRRSAESSSPRFRLTYSGNDTIWSSSKQSYQLFLRPGMSQKRSYLVRSPKSS